MKTMRIFILLFSGLFVFACTTDDEQPAPEINIPDTFTVDIPSQISNGSKGSLNGRLAADGDGIIEGEEIYGSVPYFIALGEKSADIIELTLQIAHALETQNVNSLNFTSDDDGREKRLEIVRDVTHGGEAYAYEMTMFDVADNAQALQLLWNTSPLEGVGILNAYQIDRTETNNKDAYIRIDYSENDPDYEATMTVSISGLITPNNGDIDNMKMFVGRNGDVVEVMGNSNHPNIVIIDDTFTGGRNYAFVGRGDEAADLGVIRLALPPSGVTTDQVWEDYSVRAVLQAEIESAGITDEGIIDQVLINAGSPAYFNAAGFIASGADNKPTAFSDAFVDLSGLNIFVPNDVKNLEIGFIE